MLVLSRGGFCPKDRRQHEGLLQLHREMQVGYLALAVARHPFDVRRCVCPEVTRSIVIGL